MGQRKVSSIGRLDRDQIKAERDIGESVPAAEEEGQLFHLPPLPGVEVVLR